MSPLTIYKDNYSDATVISNCFIDDYMKDANDAQLKIYLYLIRMMSANLPTSISDIADKFNLTERDIIRALKYWEEKKLLILDYNESSHISGIHIQDLDKMPKGEIVPLARKVAPAPAKVEKKAMEKPKYTPSQLRAFKDDEVFSEIIFIAEQYLEKTLSTSEINSIVFFYDTLGFSQELIDYLIEYCVGHGHKSMHYIDKVAMNWAEENITTVRQAKLRSNKYDKLVYGIMKALGKQSSPTQAEADYITKWNKEYGFDKELILTACEKAVLAVDKNRFQYTDGILNKWLKAGVHSKAQAAAFDQSFKQTKAVPQKTVGQFQDFKQNTYDYASLEQEIISN
ncbi:MAG: DnaD domain protein [Roseburia sp.]|nr:DnaD domain protein [Roseburia sp.]MCM1279956.1 DnaD domain protein [Robinsoniella sp.]